MQTKVGRFEEDAHSIRAEIRATEELQRSLFLELVDLHAARERESLSRTCRGRIVNLFGHVLVAVCVFRIVAAAVTLVFKRRRIDPVTRIMDLTNHSNAESVIGELDANERKFWSQFISFILIGVIIVSSIRHVLRRMMQFFSVRQLLRDSCCASQRRLNDLPAGSVELYFDLGVGAAASSGYGHVLPIVGATNAHELTRGISVRSFISHAHTSGDR